MARLRIAMENRAETVQAREVFHMTDFESSKRPDRGVVPERLTSVITKPTRSSCPCRVDRTAHEKINSTYTLEAIGTPFAVFMLGVVRNINLRNEG